MIVSPDYYDIMYTHSRYHPEYQHSQNKYLTNLTSFYKHLNSSDMETSNNRTRYAGEIILNEGDMIFIPSHFYYSISDLASPTSISSTTWIAMRQSTKISYLSNKLFAAVIRDPPFLEREELGILIS